MAELFLVSLNGVEKNIVLVDKTFRSESSAASKYVNGPLVQVPGSNPGDTATLIFRAYQSIFGSYQNALWHCAPASESSPFSIFLGSETTPANLS